MRIPRLVLVGDGVSPCSGLETKLRAMGYQIELITSSGQAAADSCMQLQPDLVLMAAASHAAAGVRTARRIRQACDVPVVFAAASTDQVVHDFARHNGTDGCVAADADDSSLRNTIETAIGRHRDEALLRHRLAVEQAVVFAFQIIIGSRGLAGFYVLKALGQAILCDCAQIFDLASDGSGFAGNCAWHKDRAEAVKHDAARRGMQVLPDILSNVRDAKPVTVPDIDKLAPQDADVLRACAGENVRSAIVIPVVSAKNDLLGLMCFGYNRLFPHLDHSDMQSLCAVGNVLGIYRDYRLIEDSLAQSERQFQRTFENAGIGMAIIDMQTCIVKANRQFELMLGYEPGELEGSSMIQLTHPDDDESSREKFWALINSAQKRYQIEKRYVCKDGRAIWTEMTMTVVSRDKGKPDLLVAMMVDISRSKMAEEALNRSQENLKLIAANTPDYVFVQDAELRYVTVLNPQLGLVEKDMLGRTDFDILKKEEATELANIKREVLRTGESRSASTSLLSSDGSRQYFEGFYVPRRDAAGRVDGVLGYFRNVTARYQAEEALRQSEQRYRAIIDQAADGICVMNPQAEIIEVNKAFAAMHGYTPGELLEIGLSGLDEKHMELTPDRLRRVLTGESLAFEVEHLRKDGSRFPLDVTASLVDFGGRKCIIAFHRDITERIKVEESLRRQRDMVSRIAETSPMPIVALNCHGDIILANAAAEETLGLRRDRATGRSYNSPDWRITDFSGEPFPESELPFHRVKTLGRPVYGVRHAIERPDGRRIYLSINAAPLYTASGQFDGAVMVLEDITERKQVEETLRNSEQKYRLLFDQMMNGFALHEIIRNADGKPVDYRFIEVNNSFGTMTGLDPKDIIGKTCLEVMPDTEQFWIDRYGEVALTGKAVRFEHFSGVMNRHYQVMAYSPQPGQFAAVFDDISECKQAEQALRESERKLTEARRMAQLGHWEWDIRTGKVEWCEEVFNIFGLDPKEFTPQIDSIMALSPWPEDHDRDKELVHRAMETHDRGSFEQRFLRPDNSVGYYYSTFQGRYDDRGDLIAIVGTVQDITERKRVEEERETTAGFLSMVARLSETSDLAREATAFIQQRTGCQAVGIRLKEGEDYPYFETSGFNQDFVKTENSLCDRDHTGQVVRDILGRPLLDCMCGNIISGQFDPSKPFFTEHGSFWTNSTTELLATFSEADRMGHTRNRCNSAGYESVALIPLRVGEQPLGLLQLNDHRKGIFSREMIALWERLADHLAVALARFRAEESIMKHERQLRSLASRLALSEEKDRRRLAIELHNMIGHNLASAKMKAQDVAASADLTVSGKNLADIVGILDETIDAVASMTFQLSPPVLHELGLEPAIEWLVGDMRDRYPIRITIQDDGLRTPISEECKVIIFQVVKELLFNVVKHAHAQTAAVRIVHNDGCISITVCDDGCGFDHRIAASMKRTGGGFGLFGMREQLVAIGGEMKIDSRIDAGTHIEITAPLDYSAHADETQTE